MISTGFEKWFHQLLHSKVIGSVDSSSSIWNGDEVWSVYIIVSICEVMGLRSSSLEEFLALGTVVR